MEKITKKVTGMIGVMFLCMLSVISHKKMVQAESIVSVGDTWTNGYWTKGDTEANHRYQFTIPSDGKVTVTCQSDISWGIYLMDKDCAESYNYEGSGAGGSETFSEYLKVGTYGIEFTNGYGDEGAYKFKVQFTAVSCNVPEPNNDFVSATPISLNQLQQGVLTDANQEDYFKIQLNRATTLKVVTTGEEDRKIYLYDRDFVSIRTETHNAGADMFEEYLSPGTYYIKMQEGSNERDTPYTLKCVSYQYVTGIQLRSSLLVVKKGKSANLLSAVTPSDATQKTLKWTTSDSSVATVSSTGKVTAKAVGYANITASTIDGSNISKMATVIVSPAKASLKKLKLYKYNKRQISIKVKGQKNASYQYQYAKNKKFKKAKSIRSNYTSVTTSKLSKKKKYYVRVRAYYEYNGKKYYGAWSKAKSIRTKK